MAITPENMSLSRRDFLKFSAASFAGGLTLKEGEQRPQEPTKGLYIPVGHLAGKERLAKFKETVEKTGANTVITDIKTDAGTVNVPFEHPLKPRWTYLSEDPRPLFDFLNWADKKGIRVVGRQVVSADNKLVEAHSRLGLKKKDRSLWQARGTGLFWANPFLPEIAEYNAAIAKAASSFGIKQIQLDFIRFPGIAEGRGEIDFRREYSFDARVAAIANIVKKVKGAISFSGTTLTADIFGYTAWKAYSDLEIGQHIESLAPYLDGLCPMIYPDNYKNGVPDITSKEPGSKHPFMTAYFTVKHARERLQRVNPDGFVTPWIQGWGETGEKSGATLQTGAMQAGASGVMVWNNQGNYKNNALTGA